MRSDSDAWVITKFGADASRSFVANVMAMPGSAGAQRAQLLHTGAGVARRDAHHARRADERLVLEEVDTEAALGAEEATLTIVRV